jgi:hypothetical protein
MGANAISPPRTQRDPLRMFMQANGSPFDSVRRCQTLQTGPNSPDTERSLWACRGQSWHTGATSPTWQVRSARVQPGQLGAAVGSADATAHWATEVGSEAVEEPEHYMP